MEIKGKEMKRTSQHWRDRLLNEIVSISTYVHVLVYIYLFQRMLLVPHNSTALLLQTSTPLRIFFSESLMYACLCACVGGNVLLINSVARWWLGDATITFARLLFFCFL